MEIYNIYCDLKEGVKDTDFSDAVHAFLGKLQQEGKLAAYRVTRRKLGLGPAQIPEWHILLEFENMAQMDQVFAAVSARAEPVESFHLAVNSKARNLIFSLYRDFPDPGRMRGQEKF